MSNEELDQLENLANLAGYGPWENRYDRRMVVNEHWRNFQPPIAKTDTHANGDYIAAMHPQTTLRLISTI